MSTNEWTGRGGLTRDAECSNLEVSGIPYWSASIAVNGTRYDSTKRAQVVKTTYISLVAFGWMAEHLDAHGLLKGDEVRVVGELDNREVPRPDGTKERKTRVEVAVLDIVRRSRTALAQPMTGSTPVVADPWAGMDIPDASPPGNW